MKEELKRREYCKTTSLTKSLIAFVVCLVCFVFFLFWSPSRELAKKDVKIVLKEDCNKWIYVWSGESGKLEETNETLKAGTSLKGIAEDGRWTWIVEDENGNRFGVPKLAVEGEVKELRAMNPDFHYVYRADSLTGFSLERIRKEAGDYLMADVSTRSYYFPQVVLAKGEGRTIGVLLAVDEQGLVIHTERTSELKYNLYTSAPFFYYIISWNLVTNFQPFTVDANSQPLHHKSLSSKFGSWFKGIFSSIFWFLMKLILFLLILGGLTLIVYGAASLLFVALGRMPGVKNSFIAKLEYVYMIPWMYILLLSCLYLFNSLWIILLPGGVLLLIWMCAAVEKLSIRDARCPSCAALNKLNVVEITYLTGVDVEPVWGTSWIKNTLVDVEKARRREHHLVETDTECAVCHHHTHTDSETDSVNDWKPLKEFACPKCGQHALKATSLVKDSNVKRHEYTSRKEGKIKDKGFDFVEWETRYESKDIVSSHEYWTGTITYHQETNCGHCDYHYEIDHTEKVDESPTKTSTVEEVRKWKRGDK